MPTRSDENLSRFKEEVDKPLFGLTPLLQSGMVWYGIDHSKLTDIRAQNNNNKRNNMCNQPD